MSFARPEILLLLWGVPILGVLFWRAAKKRRRILEAYASPDNLETLAPRRGGGWVRRGLFLAAFFCMVLALSGARRGYVWETIPRRGASLMLALDVSKSMLARDMAPDRLSRAKREIRDLLGRLGGERAGLTAFAGTAYIACPLTVDYGAFDLFLSALTPDNLPVGGTDLAGAVEAALSGFDPGDGAHKSIVLFSDGEGADPQQALAAAQKAADAGARIYAVGLGEPEGAPIPEKDGSFKKDADGNIVMSRREDGLLRRMAEMTGGAYAVSTPGDEDLDALFAAGLGEGLASKAAGETRIRIFRDRFQWFLGAAIVFLALEMFFPALFRRRGHAALVLAVLGAWAALSPAYAFAGAGGEADKGLSAYHSGDFHGARERFLTARVLAPDSPQAAYDAGCAAYRLGDFEEAQKLFEKASELAAKDESPGERERNLRRASLYNQGNARFRAEDLEGAVKAYEEALEVAPKDEKSRANLEYVRKLLEQRKNDQQNQDEENQGDGQDDKNKKDGGQGKNDNKRPQKNGDKGGKGDDQDGSGGAPDKKDPQPDGAGKNEPQKTQPQPEKKDEAGNPDQPNQPDQPDQPNQADQPDQADQQNQAGQDKAPAPAQPDDGENARRETSQSVDETMLNRLKDPPGMPQPPRYGRPPVTKDW